MRIFLLSLSFTLAVCLRTTAQHIAQPSLAANELTTYRISLQQCIDKAAQANLTVQAARKGAERSQALVGTAWDIEKTELTLGQDPTSGGSPDNALSLSQTMEFPTVYAARRRQLKAEAKAAQSEANVVRNKVCNQAASLYCELLFQGERLRILQRQDSLLLTYADLAEKRYKAGEIRQLEPLSAQRMLHENQMEAERARTDFANTQAALVHLINAEGSVLPAEDSLTVLTFDMQPTFNFALTPDGQLANDQLSAANQAVTAAKSAYAPSLSLSLRTQMVIKGWNPYHVDRSWNDGNFMGFEIGVGVPIFNGSTRAKVKAAKKERDMTQLLIDNQAREQQTNFNTATRTMLAAKERMTYYTSTGTASATEMARLASLDYASGDIGYLEYIDALRQCVDTQLKRAEAINDYNQAALSLKMLLGW